MAAPATRPASRARPAGRRPSAIHSRARQHARQSGPSFSHGQVADLELDDGRLEVLPVELHQHGEIRALGVDLQNVDAIDAVLGQQRRQGQTAHRLLDHVRRQLRPSEALPVGVERSEADRPVGQAVRFDPAGRDAEHHALAVGVRDGGVLEGEPVAVAVGPLQLGEQVGKRFDEQPVPAVAGDERKQRIEAHAVHRADLDEKRRAPAARSGAGRGPAAAAFRRRAGAPASPPSRAHPPCDSAASGSTRAARGAHRRGARG